MRGFRIQQCRNHLNPSSLKTIQRTLGLLSTSLPPLVLEGSQRVSESTWRTCHASSCNSKSKLRNQNQDHHLAPTVLVPSLNLSRLLLVRMKATERRRGSEEDLKEAVLFVICTKILQIFQILFWLLNLNLDDNSNWAAIWVCSCIRWWWTRG